MHCLRSSRTGSLQSTKLLIWLPCKRFKCEYNVKYLIGPRRHSSLRNTHISEDIQKTILAQEVQMKQAITELHNSRTQLESELAETINSLLPEDTEENRIDQTRAAEELHQQRTALQCSHDALKKALLQTEHHTGVKVTNVTVDHTGKVLAGLINTKGKYTTVDIMIDNIKASNGGKVIAGVVEGVKIDF
jgi:hypothetical protein